MTHPRPRRSLTAAAIAVLLASTFTQPQTANAAGLPSTDAFLKSAYTNGQFISGFTPGKPDFGFSIEGLIQRAALGESQATLSPAIEYLLNSKENTGTVAKSSGFLFNAGRLKLGLAGKWAFASAVIGAKNTLTRREILSSALSKIDGTGDVAPDASANTYDRAWLVLAFSANRFPKQAALLATNLANHQLADGGFNDGFTLGASSTDGTGITLQALAAGEISATRGQRKVLEAAKVRAVAYLLKALKTDHYESYGDYDSNGTAYAEMGLVAAGRPVAAIKNWLQGKLATDGGLQAPWSAGAGDIYATAQGAVAVLGKSYLQLTPNSEGKQ